MPVALDLLRMVTGATVVEIATEQEFENAFPDCETGAMPPFGNLYEIPVYIDASLAEYDEITFNAGTHRELMQMAWKDVVRLVHPEITLLTHPRMLTAA
jgi:Ala-tRNA(Pro) deacylase